MKANRKMIMSLVLGLFFSCALFAQTFDKDQNKEDQIKQNWIDKNSVEYNKQGGQNELVPEFNSKAEKEAWFSENAQGSESEPVPEFKTKEEKEAWFKTNKLSAEKDNSEEAIHEPRRTETKDAVLVFPDDETFPVYVKTGNKSLDDDNYAQKKQDWINNNQAKYDKMSNPSPNKVMSAEEKKERKNVNETNKK